MVDVRLGWSGEDAAGKWQKISVGCSQEFDIIDILKEWLREVATDPQVAALETVERLSHTEVFQILTLEAEFLMTAVVASKIDAGLKPRFDAVRNARAVMIERVYEHARAAGHGKRIHAGTSAGGSNGGSSYSSGSAGTSHAGATA